MLTVCYINRQPGRGITIPTQMLAARAPQAKRGVCVCVTDSSYNLTFDSTVILCYYAEMVLVTPVSFYAELVAAFPRSSCDKMVVVHNIGNMCAKYERPWLQAIR